MAANPSKASRWGSFLQQAVAGVESRLDTILAEGEEAPKPEKPATPVPATSPAKPQSDSGVSRSSSTNSRKNDRLQERLAKAIAAKNAPSNAPSRVASPPNDQTKSRSSTPVAEDRDVPPSTENEKPTEETKASPVEDEKPDQASKNEPLERIPTPRQSTPRQSTDLDAIPRISIESNGTPQTSSADPSKKSAELQRASSDFTIPSISIGNPSISEIDYKTMVTQLQSDFETAELARQEEIHGYIERIDALQAKLQYLSREAANSARTAAASAAPGSPEKRLAEKEEQIALLMEEGQKLSKTELKHMTTIKKLRAKVQEDATEATKAKDRLDKVEKEKVVLAERLKQAEGTQKNSHDRDRAAEKLQKENDALKAERDAKEKTISELTAKLEDSNSQAKQAEARALNDQLETHKKRVDALEEELSTCKIERDLAMDRMQVKLRDVTERKEREAERARAAEMEMKAEQQILESKLEMMRVRAEEASSGVTGDAQAKLLRQIETLQSQYAIASENWQSMETSLISRTTALEKERDEASRREAEVRRKARELSSKVKGMEEELDTTREKIRELASELSDTKTQLDSEKKRAATAEAEAEEVKKALVEERETKASMQNQLEEERSRWRDESMGPSRQAANPESPATSSFRGLPTEYLGLQKNLQSRRPSNRSYTSEVSPVDRFMGRRPSTQPYQNAPGTPPIRQDSFASVGTDGQPSGAPSIITVDHDDLYDDVGVGRSASPNQTINDVMSASTVGAGPSVQLVERMSAAVRRLENEKVATKEEISRLASQRDEARAEIARLMRQVEESKKDAQRVKKLEEEVAGINERYQTTLEMLGEKSELVEELRQDVQDVKAMYRELVERTVK